MTGTETTGTETTGTETTGTDANLPGTTGTGSAGAGVIASWPRCVIEVHLIGPSQTWALGSAVARVLEPGDVVVLVGQLGAGKTTLVKGLVAELGDETIATSPTFALCHLYQTEPIIAHVDCWRLENESELQDLALEELLDEGAVALIEWGEVALERFGTDALVIELFSPTQSSRSARLSATGSYRSRTASLVVSCEAAGLSPHLESDQVGHS